MFLQLNRKEFSRLIVIDKLYDRSVIWCRHIAYYTVRLFNELTPFKMFYLST